MAHTPHKGVKPSRAANQHPQGHTYAAKKCSACGGTGTIKADIDVKTRALKRV